MKRGRKIVDKTGMHFGHLTVLRYSGMRTSDKRHDLLWVCRCEYCGREWLVRSNNLHSTGTQHCGCERDRIHKEDLERKRAARQDGGRQFITT